MVRQLNVEWKEGRTTFTEPTTSTNMWSFTVTSPTDGSLVGNGEANSRQVLNMILNYLLSDPNTKIKVSDA